MFYKELKNYVTFEAETSVIYPWAMSPEEILLRGMKVKNKCKGHSDSDTLHFAIDSVCGINPILN